MPARRGPLAHCQCVTDGLRTVCQLQSAKKASAGTVWEHTTLSRPEGFVVSMFQRPAVVLQPESPWLSGVEATRNGGHTSIIYEADEHPEGHLLGTVQRQQQGRGQEVHALAVTNARVLRAEGQQNSPQRCLSLARSYPGVARERPRQILRCTL